MPEPAVLLAFVAAVLAMQAAPGPDMMLVLGRGIGQGRGVALATAFGFTMAGLVQIPLLALGVASLVQAHPWAFEVLRWCGAAYLIYLGLRQWRNAGGVRGVAVAARTGVAAAVRQGMIANLLNPKVLVFMLAFLPQFVDPAAASVALQLAVLGLIMKCCGLAVNGTIALVSGSAGDWLRRHPSMVRWQERLASSVMIGLGLKLLLDDARVRP